MSQSDYRALRSLTNTYFLITGKWLKMLMREKREEREKESAKITSLNRWRNFSR